jgi:predicted enzyme related to lactoylglutathione lyase
MAVRSGGSSCVRLRAARVFSSRAPDGATQEGAIGAQFAGRVGFFLRVEDFDAVHARMVAAGVRFHGAPRREDYGSVVVFEDCEGNKWDLLGPANG